MRTSILARSQGLASDIGCHSAYTMLQSRSAQDKQRERAHIFCILAMIVCTKRCGQITIHILTVKSMSACQEMLARSWRAGMWRWHLVQLEL